MEITVKVDFKILFLLLTTNYKSNSNAGYITVNLYEYNKGKGRGVWDEYAF